MSVRARGRVITLVCCLGACAPAIVPPREPLAPSTHRDPPAHVPPPEASPRTGARVGIVAAGGEDQARELLATLVSAIRDGDLLALRDALAPEVHRGGALRSGRASSPVDGPQLAEQLLAHARLSRLSPDAGLDELLELESIRVEPIAAVLPGGLPPDLRPGDLVIRFTVAPEARRALQPLAPDGEGMLVVRPGEDPRVIAR